MRWLTLTFFLLAAVNACVVARKTSPMVEEQKAVKLAQDHLKQTELMGEYDLDSYRVRAEPGGEIWTITFDQKPPVRARATNFVVGVSKSTGEIVASREL